MIYLHKIGWFVGLVLLQVLILNNVHIAGYATPFLYIYLILKFNSEISRNTLMVWAFFLGLTVDIFSDTPGMNAAATVWLAFLRPTLLRLFVPRDKLDNLTPAISTMGIAPFFKYVVGDVGFMSYISLIGVLPTFLVLFMPAAIKRIGAMGFIRIGLFCSLAGFALVGVFSRVLPVVIVGQVLGTAGLGLFTTFSSFFVIQCMAYGEWKTGYKLESMMDAMPSFATKIGQGVAASLAGFGLTLIGFDSQLETQSAFTQGGLTAMVSVVPLVFVVLALLLTQMYRRLDKNIMKVDEDLANGIHADASSLSL